jgi:hypothetical protein
MMLLSKVSARLLWSTLFQKHLKVRFIFFFSNGKQTGLNLDRIASEKNAVFIINNDHFQQ